MTQSEFAHVLSTLNTLSAEQMRLLRRELDSRMAAQNINGQDATEETAFDVASRAGLIGCIKGQPRSPTDLTTNSKHMEGFGRG